MPKKTILLINGSCGGDSGNTAALLEVAAQFLAPRAEVAHLVLDRDQPRESYEERLRAAHGFVFATGTYWDSWGSALQRFLEVMTPTEGSELWLGKPAAAIVSMHSVGGKGVLSRLQGVLNTLGAAIPPMCGFVYSAANQLALEAPHSELADDLWRPDDLEVLCHNLLEACAGTAAWRSWPVDRAGYDRKWFRR